MLKTFQQTDDLYIAKTAGRHHSQETYKMNNEKIVQKILRGKSNTWETKYVESNGAKDMVEPKLYTNRNESFDTHLHKFEAKSTLNSNSKTTKKFSAKISSDSQDKVGDDGETKGFQNHQ